MDRIKLTLVAALLGVAAGTALAAEPESNTTRQQRMDDALQNYRSNQPSQPGRFERAENAVKRDAHKTGAAIKRGAHKTGEAIEHGAQKVGHAVGKGVDKTGAAIKRGGEKLEGASTPKQ